MPGLQPIDDSPPAGQPGEDVDAALEGFVTRGVGNPHVRVAAGKDPSGDHEQVVLDGLGEPGFGVHVSPLSLIHI